MKYFAAALLAAVAQSKGDDKTKAYCSALGDGLDLDAEQTDFAAFKKRAAKSVIGGDFMGAVDSTYSFQLSTGCSEGSALGSSFDVTTDATGDAEIEVEVDFALADYLETGYALTVAADGTELLCCDFTADEPASDSEDIAEEGVNASSLVNGGALVDAETPLGDEDSPDSVSQDSVASADSSTAEEGARRLSDSDSVSSAGEDSVESADSVDSADAGARLLKREKALKDGADSISEESVASEDSADSVDSADGGARRLMEQN